uniref:Uncharacterized protein n=1 Tax=Denticeps clupeoides TaxID=299321 RepID=A0AAY4EM16_9TELE
IRGLVKNVQNCFGVDKPVLSPEPPAGSTTATGKSTAPRPAAGSSGSASRVRKRPGSTGLSAEPRSLCVAARIWTFSQTSDAVFPSRGTPLRAESLIRIPEPDAAGGGAARLGPVAGLHLSSSAAQRGRVLHPSPACALHTPDKYTCRLFFNIFFLFLCLFIYLFILFLKLSSAFLLCVFWRLDWLSPPCQL